MYVYDGKVNWVLLLEYKYLFFSQLVYLSGLLAAERSDDGEVYVASLHEHGSVDVFVVLVEQDGRAPHRTESKGFQTCKGYKYQLFNSTFLQGYTHIHTFASVQESAIEIVHT